MSAISEYIGGVTDVWLEAEATLGVELRWRQDRGLVEFQFYIPRKGESPSVGITHTEPTPLIAAAHMPRLSGERVARAKLSQITLVEKP